MAAKRKSTDKVTLERVYRRILAMDKDMVTQLAIVRLNQAANHAKLDAKIDALAPIVAHCERLMREKETLRKLSEANQFMAEPPTLTPAQRVEVMRGWLQEDEPEPVAESMPIEPVVVKRPVFTWSTSASTCTWKHLHRPGIPCAICGNLEIVYPRVDV